MSLSDDSLVGLEHYSEPRRADHFAMFQWRTRVRCSGHQVIYEEERVFRFDFRGIDLLEVQKFYPRFGHVMQPSLFEKSVPNADTASGLCGMVFKEAHENHSRSLPRLAI